MKKLSKITSLVSAFVLSLVLSEQSAYADVIVPGVEGGSSGRLIPKNELITYGVVAGVIIVVVVVSVIVLIKIRKKNVNK